MKTRINRICLNARGKTILAVAALMMHSIGCAAPSTAPTPSADTGTFTSQPPVASDTPTTTPSPRPTHSIPADTLTPTIIPTTALPTSTWKSGWVDFINSYYGYAISVPPLAQIHINDQVDGYDPNELPADWNEKESYFDYLNMTYPPGLCATIEFGSGFIEIKVADWLGGKYKDCAYIGGIGAETNFVWVWSEEEIVVGNKSYTATVLRQCESHDTGAKCGEWEYYAIPLDAGARISLAGITWNPQTSYDEYLKDKTVLLEVLRSYREAPRTALYCPQPAPTRLSAGGYTFVSADPPVKYNNIRNAPGINQALIGSIAPGKAVELLEGPVCNNSLQWWQVRVLETGLVGWTPEGDHRSFWLIPCESKEKCGAP